MSLPYNGNLIPRAKELRKEMTPQEKKLWYGFLNRYFVRFQRQKVIDRFIVDFFCHKAKLVVELDGSQHFTEDGIASDMERSAVLEGYGLKVIRFTNREVDRQFYEVCQAIDNEVRGRLPQSALPQSALPQSALPQSASLTAPSERGPLARAEGEAFG